MLCYKGCSAGVGQPFFVGWLWTMLNMDIFVFYHGYIYKEKIKINLMYRTSTYFIKGQINGTTKEDLIKFYVSELEEQSVSDIVVQDNRIQFSNNIFRFVLNRFANKFSSFSEGEIEIAENETEYIIYLRSKMNRLFIKAGLNSLIIMLLASLSLGSWLITFILGLIIFIFLLITGLISDYVFFPVYFTNVRNDIERKLQSKNSY